MHVTLNYNFINRRKVKFIHTKPTSYFLINYANQFVTAVSTTRQKLPRISRRSLVKLL